MIEKISITDASVINEIHQALPTATYNDKGLLNNLEYKESVRITPTQAYAETGKVIKLIESTGQGVFAGILTCGRIEGYTLTCLYVSVGTAKNGMYEITCKKLSGGTRSPLNLYYVIKDNVLSLYAKTTLDYAILVLKTILKRGSVAYSEEQTELPTDVVPINIE